MLLQGSRCEYIKAASCFRCSLGQCLAGGQLAAHSIIPAPLPPSPGIILAYPLSPSSRLSSSFLNLCNSGMPHNTSLHPSFFLTVATTATTPCCTQDQLIYSLYLVFLSFAPLVVVSANGVVFFFSCID
jgi:hypothetical protein